MMASAELVWRWGVPAFALVAMAVVGIASGNAPLFLALNRAMSPLGDALWSHFTILGDTTLAMMFILPFIGRRPQLVWQLLLGAIIAGLVSRGMKELFDVARPPAVLDPGSFHIIGQALRNVSFPSGHTTTAFAAAALFCLRVARGPLRYLILFMAIMVGLSRIACGVHWPMDVLGGMLIGWLSAMAGIWLGEHWERAGCNVWLQRVLGVLGVGVAVWLIADYDNAYPGTRGFQIVLSAFSLAVSLPSLLPLYGIAAKGRSA